MENRTTTEKPRLNKRRTVAFAGAAAVTSVAVLGSQGAFGSDKPKPVRPDQEKVSIYEQPGAAQELINNDMAKGETAIYVVKDGDNPSEIAHNLGSDSADEQIVAQNGGSSTIHEDERYALSVEDLGPKAVLTTAEIPANIGIGSDGEVAAYGPLEEVQVVTAPADIAHQGPG